MCLVVHYKGLKNSQITELYTQHFGPVVIFQAFPYFPDNQPELYSRDVVPYCDHSIEMWWQPLLVVN